MESAKAEGEKIRLIGAADARAVEAVGRWVAANIVATNLREVSQRAPLLMIICCSGRRLSGCE